MLHRTWPARFASLALGASFIAAPAFAADVAATDWPEFHGPKRDNISADTGLLKEWKQAPQLAWQIKTVGAGYSSVSVAKGRIYTAGDDGDSSYVFAINVVDGSQLWKAKLGRPGGGSGYAGPRATPTVDGDTIYMISQFGDVVAYRAADGNELWRKNLNSDLGGKMASGWGNSESLVVEGDKILCTPGGKQGTMAAFNKKTGELVWRSTELTDPAAYMAPVVVDLGGVRQAITLTHQSVAAINVADGKLVWRADRPGQTAVIPTPVVHIDKANPNVAHVFTTSGYGVGCDLFKITAEGGKFTPSKVYTNKNMVNHHGGVILLDAHVYGYSDGKGWTCMDLISGEAKWKDKDLLGKGTISYADNRFYLRDEKSGDIVLLEATPEKHEERGRLKQPERSGKNAWPHLVIANGKLFVRDQASLFCYDIKAK